MQVSRNYKQTGFSGVDMDWLLSDMKAKGRIDFIQWLTLSCSIVSWPELVSCVLRTSIIATVWGYAD